MTFEFEYLGEFEFIFESILGLKSGDQGHSFYDKKRKSKISCKCTFKGLEIVGILLGPVDSGETLDLVEEMREKPSRGGGGLGSL
jgi:hypothetical protein